MLSEAQSLLLDWLRSRAAAEAEAGHIARAERIILGALDLAGRHPVAETENRGTQFSILADAGAILVASGKYERAAHLLRQALDLAGGETPVPPAALAEARQHLGTALDALGDEDGAAEAFEIALDLLDTLDPPPLASIAHLSNNLGMILRQQGDYGAAAALYGRAQQIFESLGEPHALDLATVCNNQGSLFWAWQQPALARDFHLAALSLRRKLLPSTHADIGQSASNLAAVYHDTGDREKAGRNYQRALRILRHNLAEHLETYEAAAENYAELLEITGKAGKAKRLRAQTARHLSRAGDSR